MNIIRKTRSFFKLISGGRYGFIFSKIPPLKYIITASNYFPLNKKYSYILLAGHGMGLQSMMFYLKKIQAKPKGIFANYMIPPFLFFKEIDGIVIERAHSSKIIQKIIDTLTLKVPCYQIVRDPIDIIKSYVNISCLDRISSISNKKDMEILLLNSLQEYANFMFYFTSMQNSVRHICKDITYLTQDLLSQEKLEATINAFADRLGYQRLFLDKNTSVKKGSIFPRLFPLIFKVGNSYFALVTEGRENGYSALNVDLYVEKKIQRLPKKISKIKTIIIPEYADYPLDLVAINQDNLGGGDLSSVEKVADASISFAIASIQKHSDLSLTTQEIITFLTSNENYEFGKQIAQKIYIESQCIRKDRPDILENFHNTRKFLNYFNLDYCK